MVDVQRLVFAQPYWPAFSSGAVDFIPLLDGCLHVRRRAARIPLLFFFYIYYCSSWEKAACSGDSVCQLKGHSADGFTAPVYFIFDDKI